MAAQACAGNFVAGASLGPTCLVPKAPFKDMDFGYYLRMVNAVYAIDDFPGDALLWRIEWIGGVGYNTSVPSDPQISICLAQLPAGQTDPLSARSRSSHRTTCNHNGFRLSCK